MPSSLATWAMLPPAAWTISTASALNSGVNFRRLLVDMTDSFRARRRNHQVSVKPGQHQRSPSTTVSSPTTTTPPPEQHLSLSLATRKSCERLVERAADPRQTLPYCRLAVCV